MNKISTLILFLLIFSFLPLACAEEPAGYIIIEKIGLFKSIHHIPDSDTAVGSYYYDLSNLQYGVGHLENTTWGNMLGGRTVLVGHTPGAFSDLVQLDVGDEIVLGMDGNYYTLHVSDKYLVLKSNDSVISTPSYRYELVLITCVEGDKDKRLIIKAT